MVESTCCFAGGAGQEARLLREEVAEARLAEQLGESRRACEEVWSQRWLLRIGGAFDVLLVIWIIWARFPLYRRDIPSPAPLVLADTGGSSSDTDEVVEQFRGANWKPKGPVQGKGTVGKNRPTRPSDLKSLRLT